jgi:hypothetical protein
MPSHIKIIHAHELIKASPDGQFDLEKSGKLIERISIASDSMKDYEIIVDTRRMRTIMSITDLYYLAAELAKFRKHSLKKIAIICQIPRLDYAAFFAVCSQNRGFNVNAFSSYENAMEWLIEPICLKMKMCE